MPKDATKNVDRYKIRGGQLNEFDFNQNQAALAEKQDPPSTNLIPGTPPEARTEGLRPAVAKTKRPAKTTAAKSAKATTRKKAAKATTAAKSMKGKKAARPAGASAKKLAARKAAKKK